MLLLKVSHVYDVLLKEIEIHSTYNESNDIYGNKSVQVRCLLYSHLGSCIIPVMLKLLSEMSTVH